MRQTTIDILNLPTIQKFLISLFTSRREEILKKNEEKKLQEIDICSYVMKDRPNTKWKFFAVTNVQFFLYYSDSC